MRKFLFFLILSLFIGLDLLGDGMNDVYVDQSDNGKYLTGLLGELEKEYQVDFIYREEVLKPYQVFGIQQSYKMVDFLRMFLQNFYITQIKEDVITIIGQAEFGRMAADPVNFLLLYNEKGDPAEIKGTLVDIYSKEPLYGADIIIPALKTGTRTNQNGFFKINVPQSIYEVEIRHIGYETIRLLTIFSPLGEENAINLAMNISSTELENVTILGDAEDSQIRSRMTGIERLGIETIKSLPTFMGEVDPIRSITTLPGVSTAGELSSGFNVRGGEAGQNLILQDGAVIYNPTHLFGIFSAFNPDLVNDIRLYKGGGPASFGGRAASVLEIDLKNGNLKSHSFSGGVGLVSSRLTVEGPIKKDKISYIVGGRISYTNWLVRRIKDVQMKNSEAKFHDLTAKILFHPNKKNLFTVSGYYSYDDFKLGNDSIFSWNTKNLSVKWDHTFNEKLSSMLTLSSSNYESNVDYEDGAESFFYQNSVNNLLLKYEMLYAVNEDFILDFGLEGSGSMIEPGNIRPVTDPTNVLAKNVEDYHSVESAFFLQGNYDLNENLGFSLGLRYSQFLRLGKGNVYYFDYQQLNGRYPSIYDTVSYASGEVISSYGGFEPRLSVRYSFNDNASVKASYYRTRQYLQLLSNTITPSPLDYWIASGPYVKPTISDQYTLGFYQNLHHDLYEVSVEAFYKVMANTVDYIEGADLILNEAPEQGLTQGDGRAYGLELQIKRKEENFNGWISYTYSRSLRKYDSGIPILRVNSGEYYSSIYDTPHDLSVVANYRILPRVVFSLNFNYKSGRPITIPVSKFSYGPVLSVLNYSDRNEYRMPDYHRLDITFTLEDKMKRNKRFKGEWSFSIYNLYGRKNAYSIYFDEYGTAHKVSILGSVFPSLSYNFKF